MSAPACTEPELSKSDLAAIRKLAEKHEKAEKKHHAILTDPGRYRNKLWPQQLEAAGDAVVKAKKDLNEKMVKIMRAHWKKNKDYYQPDKRYVFDDDKSPHYLLAKVAKPAGHNCPICCQSLTAAPGDARKTPCGHMYHHECIKTWITGKWTCPTCRKFFTVVDSKTAAKRTEEPPESFFMKWFERFTAG